MRRLSENAHLLQLKQCVTIFFFYFLKLFLFFLIFMPRIMWQNWFVAKKFVFKRFTFYLLTGRDVISCIKCKLTYTVRSRSSYPYYIVSYYIKWVTTSWAYSVNESKRLDMLLVRTRPVYLDSRVGIAKPGIRIHKTI